MGKQMKILAGFILMLGTATLACTVPGFGPSGPAPTPTPLGDSLSFVIPAYSYELSPGDTVPGTRLEYVAHNGDTFEVRIDGQSTTKRLGDSFIWSGIVAPGVFTTYNLRLAPAVFGPLPVIGSVTVNVLNPAPVELPALPQPAKSLRYGNIILTYDIPVGRQIPGSTLVYEGVTTQGNVKTARLSGLSGHPLFALGDSVNWQGQLRGNVFIQYNLRVLAIDETSLRLGGTAELLIAE
jgi:hypothetical protein